LSHVSQHSYCYLVSY